MRGSLLDCRQLAERLNVPVRLVRRLILEKRIPYLKVGRYVRFDGDDVDAWLASNQTLPRNVGAGSPHAGRRRLPPTWR